MKKIISIIKFIPRLPIIIIKAIIHIKPKDVFLRIKSLVIFAIILTTYLSQIFISWFFKLKFIPRVFEQKLLPPLNKFCDRLYRLGSQKGITINRVALIQIAIRNMRYKPARTFITIGGMAVGIAAIAFLVSIGYGLQRLVVSRVARLEELKQIDVAPQVGSQLEINDETINNFSQIPEVEYTLPLIAAVGRVNYQNSESDAAVFGVTSEYLRQSAVQPVRGKIFDSDELAKVLPLEQNFEAVAEVAGLSTESLAEPITISIEQGKWIRVRNGAGTSNDIIGYTRRPEGVQKAKLAQGEPYQGLDGKQNNSWINADVYLWEETECPVENHDCVDGEYKVMRDGEGAQVQKNGYFAEIYVTVEPVDDIERAVLGVSVLADTEEATASADEQALVTEEVEESTESALVVVEGEDGFVEIPSETGDEQAEAVRQVELGEKAKKEAVVNRAMLNVMGISEDDAIGKEFEAIFIIVSDLLSEGEDKVESVPATYKIVGVDPDEETPFFYVPFIDLRSLGIVNYSQLKVIAKSQNDIEQIRQQIEANGYTTASVVDTVAQIDSLFATVRLLLASIGMVALSVAGLGMFNTMSVSLLERTREVGLMKAMGMRSHEVRELFLTESMTMGFFGGLLGILMGIGAGKLISALISIVAVSRGVGFIDISYLPPSFSAFIISLSIIVGLVTGMYPARRATKISALDALRYE